MFDSDKHWILGFLLKLPVAEMDVSAILTQKFISIFSKFIYSHYTEMCFNSITA